MNDTPEHETSRKSDMQNRTTLYKVLGIIVLFLILIFLLSEHMSSDSKARENKSKPTTTEGSASIGNEQSRMEGNRPAEKGAQVKEEDVVMILQKQVAAANNSDLEGYMDAMDSSQPTYYQSRQLMKELFDKYKFQFILENAIMIKGTNNFATVRTTLVTKLISGPTAGQNNRTITDNDLELIGGKWKITTTRLVKMEAL